MTSIPRVVVAAPSSGCGKTTVATGLMAAFAARGLAVSGHKVGPDYIDPGYHSLATTRPPRNLDAVLCGEERVAPLFAHGSAGADIAVVEGVMGLFDGAAESAGFPGPGDFASTAHVAALLDAPVVLVVDAARTSRSIAALIHGFATYDDRVRVAGVILNRVGSERHEEMLRDACVQSPVPVLGAIRRSDAVSAPSRHLGLIPAAERGAAARSMVEALSELVARSCDLDAIAAVARTAPPVAAEPWEAAAELAAAGHRRPVRARVAVAGGAAFTFSYTEQAELLAAGGAEVAVVDPLAEEKLPPGSAGLVLGGGFPEVHAGELSANAPLRAEVARLAGGGAPVVAECAGLLYLCRSLDGAPMCGVLPAEAAMTERLALGYRHATAAADSLPAAAGTRLRGHEFHRTRVSPPHGRSPAWRWAAGGAEREEGFTAGTLYASYLHLHWAGVPESAARFLDALGRGEDS